MRVIEVGENEAGQRLDRVLMRYMGRAPQSFIYKMLRKKNITLNGKRAEGKERLEQGDEIRLFLSDETIDGFSKEIKESHKPHINAPVVYEDGHVIFFNKPAGVLSQKAKGDDYSLCEFLVDYMLEKGEISEGQLRTFRPGVANRLDRNTTGLVAAGKTLEGARGLNDLFRTRELHKYYRAIVVGEIEKKSRIEGYLKKDPHTNLVKVIGTGDDGVLPICTEYMPLETFEKDGRKFTLLEINLITGRSHQIRAHLASVGHPLAGDPKYGDEAVNRDLSRRYGIRYQLLHCCRMEFPALSGALFGLSERKITATAPENSFHEL